MNNYDSKGLCMHKESLDEAKSHQMINIIDSFRTPIWVSTYDEVVSYVTYK
jgi:hypothetical protein